MSGLPLSGELEAIRHQAVIDAGNACIQWFIDTDDCHFCNPILAEHEEHCPLREYFGAINRYRKAGDYAASSGGKSSGGVG